MTEGEEMLRLEGLCKSFGITKANKNVSLELAAGEVRGLAGENGSGKSTLMSIVAGIQRADSGRMFLRGNAYAPESPADANEARIGIVVQELGLVDALPVGVNMFLGRSAEFSRFGVIDMARLYRKAEEELERWRLSHIPVRSRVEGLSVEDRKLIELARALSVDPDLLILDEVSAALSHDKRELLYGIISSLRSSGKSVIMIAHDLEEILAVADSVTVMKDGEVVDTRKASELDLSGIKRMMVGRDIGEDYYRPSSVASEGAAPALEVSGLGLSGAFDDISFTLRRGEILGICGLSDAGIHELGKALFGALHPDSGSVVACAAGREIRSPAQAIACGCAYVPKDRDGEALMLEAPIEANVCLPSALEMSGPLGFLSPRALNRRALDAIGKYSVKTVGPEQRIGRLSGGNKQKVNLARWLMRDIVVLVLDCPTRGVDIGVKARIYEMINEARNSGLAIVLISDELPEVIGMSDRILVMKNGKSAGIYARGDGFTEERMIEVMI